MLHRTIAVSVLLSFSLAPAFAQRSHGTPSMSPPAQVDDDVATAMGLSGSVRTGNNKPATDVRIEVVNIGTGQPAADAYTRQDGTFDISNIPNGTYEVRAVMGLQEAHERVDIRGGSGNVNLRFAPAEAGDAGGRDSVSVAQLKVPGKARDAFKKAQAAMGKQKLDEAAKYVDEALTAYPEYSDALTLRGVLKLDAGKAAAALEDLDHAIKADSANSMAYIAMGAAYNSLEKYDDALRTLDRGSSLGPSAWQAYFEMGKAFMGKGSFDAALRQLNKAEDLGPKDYVLIHLVKAHALLGMKNYSEAMAELQWYLDKAPADQQSAEARQTLEKVRSFAAVNTPGK
jgi:tetratricopeptide (TPR) repeat protein